MGPCKECLVNSTCMEPCDKLSNYLNENKMLRRILLHYQKKLTCHSNFHSHTLPNHMHSGYASVEPVSFDLTKLLK